MAPGFLHSRDGFLAGELWRRGARGLGGHPAREGLGGESGRRAASSRAGLASPGGTSA